MNLLVKDLMALLAAIDQDRPEELAAALARGNGISAWARAFGGESPLLTSAALADAVSCARLLVELGAPIEGESNEGLTPLLSAADQGSPKTLHFLIQAGADREPCAPLGRTPMALAAAGGHLECVKILLEARFPFDERDIDGWTPAMHAARGDYPEVLAILLDSGADPRARNDRGETMLAVAADHGCLDAVGAIIARASPTQIPKLGIEMAIALARKSSEARCADAIEAFALSALEKNELAREVPPTSTAPSKRPAL